MENEGFKHLRRKILSRVLLVPFFTVLLVCGTLVYYFSTNLGEFVAPKLVQIADAHRTLIDQFLQERAFDLQFAAESYGYDALLKDQMIAECLDFLRQGSQDAFLDIGVFDADGNHRSYEGPFPYLEGKNYAEFADAEWFQAVKTKSVYISDVFLGYRKIPHFVIAVRQKEGDKDWYLRATIDTRFFNELVNNIRVGRTGEAYLVNRAGILQTSRRSGGREMERDPNYANYKSDLRNIVSFRAADAGGSSHLYATGMLPATGWLLVVRQEVGEAYMSLFHAVAIAIGIIMVAGVVIGFISFILASSLANDLTIADMEKKHMSSQLIMAGKLAEIGEMSSGIAHEINNPLQIMKAEQGLIGDIMAEVERDKALNDENRNLLRDSVNQIGLQIDRCKGITQGLLKFARKTEPSIQQIRIPTLIREVVNMVEQRAHVEGVTIAQEFESGLPEIHSDPAQLQQVFLNLLNNSLYALKNRHCGKVTIGAQKDGDGVLISVADNGCGIAPDQIEKIFVPFYTTKPIGQGTGLGLSTSYGIVEHLGGKINVQSEPNQGTTFTIWLPLRAPHSAEVA